MADVAPKFDVYLLDAARYFKGYMRRMGADNPNKCAVTLVKVYKAVMDAGEPVDFVIRDTSKEGKIDYSEVDDTVIYNVLEAFNHMVVNVYDKHNDRIKNFDLHGQLSRELYAGLCLDD